MNHIIDELNQYDEQFIQIPYDKKLIKFDKLYTMHFKINGRENYIIIKYGIQLCSGTRSEIEIYEITDQLSKLNLSSDEQEASTLLDYDKTSSEEEVLGISFNIPYRNKFIPGNKIHKELAFKEEIFKTNFWYPV